ncbi:MAG: hypothetical protein QXH42_09055 [Thermoplasmata archaeon]
MSIASSIIGIARGVPRVAMSAARDVYVELRKWLKGSKRLDVLPGKPTITHVQGVAVFVVFIVALAGMFSYQASSIALGQIPVQGGGGGGGRPVSYEGWELQKGTASSSGNVEENSQTAPETLQITERNLAEVKFTLTWRDEPDQYPLHTNKPDELGIKVTTPWGENRSASGKNAYDPAGGTGTVTLDFTVTQYKLNGDNGTGDWQFAIFAKDCGNHTPRRIGLLQWLDNGNSYELSIEWSFYVKPAK